MIIKCSKKVDAIYLHIHIYSRLHQRLSYFVAPISLPDSQPHSLALPLPFTLSDWVMFLSLE